MMIKPAIIKELVLCSAITFSPLVISLEVDKNAHYHDPMLLADHQILAKHEAIDIARRRHNGKVLSANLVHGKSHSYYKIKLINDKGRVKTVKVNAIKRHKNRN